MNKYIFQWSESSSLLIVQSWAKAFLRTSDQVSGNLDVLAIVENRAITNYVTRDNVAKSEKFAVNFVDAGFQKSFLRGSQRARRDFDELYENMQSAVLAVASSEYIADLLERYHECLIEVMKPFLMLQAEFTNYPYDFLKRSISRNSKDVDAVAALLATPDKLDILKRQQIALSKLRRMSEKQLTDALREHAYEYSILFYNSYNENANVEFLRGQLKDVSDYEELQSEFQRELTYRCAEQRQFEDKLDEKAKHVAKFLRELGYERLELKNSWAGAEFRFSKLFKEVAKRTELSMNEVLGFCTFDDLLNFFRRGIKINESVLHARKKLYLIEITGGKLSLLHGVPAAKRAQELIPAHFSSADFAEIRGAVANPGKVSGKAKIVRVIGIEALTQSMKEFEDGEVLITTMTQPNMLPMARRACALVTDEGGMTSHAAIIARELGIPCIVGTHFATKVIKTGDLIEVDANKGIVRKL